MKSLLLISALSFTLFSCASPKPQFDKKTEAKIHSTVARDDITGRLHLLFRSVDGKNWDAVREILASEVEIDMGSGYQKKSAEEVIKMWQDATAGKDAVHHLVSNYGIEVFGQEAKASFMGHAIHFKKGKKGRASNHFYGSYLVHLTLAEPETWKWKISKFQYLNKFND